MIRMLALACALLLLPTTFAVADAEIIAAPDMSYLELTYQFDGIFCTSTEAAVEFERYAQPFKTDKAVVASIPHFNENRVDICGVDSVLTFSAPQMVKAYSTSDGPTYVYKLEPEGRPPLYSWQKTPYAFGATYRI